MKLSIFLTMLLLAPAVAFSSDVFVSASQTDCLPADPDTPDEIAVDVEACALRIRHRNVVTNCCLEYEVTATVQDGTIEVEEIDVGPPCDCLCPFDLEIILSGLEAGAYRLVLHAFLHRDPVIEDVMIPEECPAARIFSPEVWTHPAIEGVTVPVYAAYERPLEAFSFGTTFPLEHARMADVHVRGTDTEIAGAEFVSVEIENGDGAPAGGIGWATCSVVLGRDPNAELGAIPPGPYRHLANLVYDILPPGANVPRSISVPFPESVGEPPVRLRFTLDGEEIQPAPGPGIIQIVLPLPEFLRGDADDDRAVDILDAQMILDFLFLGRGELPCADAADANDDGRIDIADAISVLVFLFGGGSLPPPEPSGVPGADPTLDRLGCARDGAAP